MRITLDEELVVVARYDTFDELMAAYTEYCDRQGREVPKFALEMLLGEMVLWLIGFVGERLLDSRRRRRDDQRLRQIAESNASVASRLEAIERKLSDAETRNDVVEPGAVLDALKTESPRVEIVLETPAEGDLKRSFEVALSGVRDVIIVVRLRRADDIDNEIES